MPAATITTTTDLLIRDYKIRDYAEVLQLMQNFNKQRTANTCDELWHLQHYPVFTLGQAASPHHILNAKDIPVAHTDRGGQVTYHGLGQLVCYLLIDLKRKHLSVRAVIAGMQQAVVNLLADYNIVAHLDQSRPGVYIANSKICALGIKVRKGCMYHGLSLNIAMDLQPFSLINPCGEVALKVTQLRDFAITADFNTITNKLINHIKQIFGYTALL